MRKQKLVNKQRWRRTNRVRKKLRGDATCPRLSVRRSNKHLYCQLIDDDAGKTLASASTRDKTLAEQIGYGGNCEAAKIIGVQNGTVMSRVSRARRQLLELVDGSEITEARRKKN